MSYCILNHKGFIRCLFLPNFGRAQVGYLRGYSPSIKIGIANVLR